MTTKLDNIRVVDTDGLTNYRPSSNGDSETEAGSKSTLPAGTQSFGESVQSERPPKNASLEVVGIVAYYTLCFGLLFWLFLDLDLGKFGVVSWLMRPEPGQELDPRLGYVLIGGALGSVLYSIRALHKHYIDGKWDNRWLGKYITAPLEGSALALVVYVLLQGGAAVIGFHSGPDPNAVNPMAGFGVSLLVGFSTTDVVKWLEARAKAIFKVKSDEEDTQNKNSSPQNSPVPHSA